METSTRRGTQRHSTWRLSFVPGAIDPIGDQDDVPCVFVLCVRGGPICDGALDSHRLVDADQSWNLSF